MPEVMASSIFTNKSVPSANELATPYLVFPSLDHLMTLQAHRLVRGVQLQTVTYVGDEIMHHSRSCGYCKEIGHFKTKNGVITCPKLLEKQSSP